MLRLLYAIGVPTNILSLRVICALDHNRIGIGVSAIFIITFHDVTQNKKVDFAYSDGNFLSSPRFRDVCLQMDTA